MQFYLNGYAPGDPDIRAAVASAEMRSPGLPEGCGELRASDVLFE